MRRAVGDKKPEPQPAKEPKVESPTFGKNFDKKVRKHIDQVRKRHGVKEDIPEPGRGGIGRVEEIIRARVAQGGGVLEKWAGEDVIAFYDGAIKYIFRLNGEFWMIVRTGG
jgi:hypothetical protein